MTQNPIKRDGMTVSTEDECWLGFWEIVGRAAYRIWLAEQQADYAQAAVDSESTCTSASTRAA